MTEAAAVVNPSSKPVFLRRRRPPRLSAWLAESLRRRRYRAAACPELLDHDWAAMPYNRVALVNRLIAVAGEDYLEIGCDADLLFKAAMAARKVGVDPRQGGTHRMTSNAWFAANPDRGFDVVFIDGLHLYPQVHRDIANALAVVRPGGFVAVHDMAPRDWVEEHVPKISNSRWTGDGWKCAFELLASDGVDFRLVAIDHGVLVARPTTATPRLADLSSELAERAVRHLPSKARRTADRGFRRRPRLDRRRERSARPPPSPSTAA